MSDQSTPQPHIVYVPVPTPPPASTSTGNNMAIASAVCGLLGVPLLLACYIGVIPAIVGLVCGMIALSESRKNGGEGKTLATVGIVSSALVLMGAPVLLGFSYLYAMGSL